MAPLAIKEVLEDRKMSRGCVENSSCNSMEAWRDGSMEKPRAAGIVETGYSRTWLQAIHRLASLVTGMKHIKKQLRAYQ